MIYIVYLGSKSKIAKYIVPIIQSYIDSLNADLYVEPFVGGANVIDKIQCDTKIGCDNNHFLIELLKNSFQVLYLPDDVSQEEYNKVRQSYYERNGDYQDWYIGAIGFLDSYNGKFFACQCKTTKTKDGTIRNYFDEHKRNFIKQSENFKDVIFIECDYCDLDTHNSVIYCDPPYRNTTDYKNNHFDSDKFWKWAEEKSETNIVLVSEESAPNNWECIWEKDILRTVDYSQRLARTEKLFKLKRT